MAGCLDPILLISYSGSAHSCLDFPVPSHLKPSLLRSELRLEILVLTPKIYLTRPTPTHHPTHTNKHGASRTKFPGPSRLLYLLPPHAPSPVPHPASCQAPGSLGKQCTIPIKRGIIRFGKSSHSRVPDGYRARRGKPFYAGAARARGRTCATLRPGWELLPLPPRRARGAGVRIELMAFGTFLFEPRLGGCSCPALPSGRTVGGLGD